MGGKIELMEAGAFSDIDLVFMAHPAQQDAPFLPCVALEEQVSHTLSFRGLISCTISL